MIGELDRNLGESIEILNNYLFEFQKEYDGLHGLFVCESDGKILLYDVEESPIIINNIEEGKTLIKNHFESWYEQILKWGREDAEEVKLMSNDELLWKTVSAAQGDDWDGMFSKRGEKRFKLLREELEKRLKEIKFL